MYTLGASPLPVLPNSSAAVDQYDVLARGAGVGGNFPQFKDAVAQGWFTNDKAGYASYLAYNSQQFNNAKGHPDFPELIGWYVAGVMASAVVNRQRTGNSTSPVYDVPTGQANGLKLVLQFAGNHGLSAAQRDAASQAFASHYARLLQAWGYRGPVSTAPAPQMIEHPYFKALGLPTQWVDVATIDYNGPDPDPNIIGGRLFRLKTGQAWKWGGQTAGVAPTQQLQIFVDANDIRYDVAGHTLWGTRAWRIRSAGGTAPGGARLPDSYSPFTRWVGQYIHDKYLGPRTTLFPLQQASAADIAAINAVAAGPSTPPPASWGIGSPSYATPAGPTGPTVDPYTDIAVPPPPTSGAGVQVLPPLSPSMTQGVPSGGGVVPGAAVPIVGGGNGGGTDVVPSVASSGGGFLIVAAALGALALFAGKPRRA